MFCFSLRFPLRLLISSLLIHALASAAEGQPGGGQKVQQLRQMVLDLQARVSALELQNAASHGAPGATGASGPEAAAELVRATAILRRAEPAQSTPAEAASQQPASGDVPPAATPAGPPAALPAGATLNFMLDGYYEYNTNQPIGRVNNLRAYDVLSNSFSINQADVIAELPAILLLGTEGTAYVSTYNSAKLLKPCRAILPMSRAAKSTAISSRRTAHMSFQSVRGSPSTPAIGPALWASKATTPRTR